jgi:PAS domain S-box-containing protein
MVSSKQLHDVADNVPGQPIHHWNKGVVDAAGFDKEHNIFFVAVEMTRMPMAISDPKQPDNPLVFANHAFYELTGYSPEEVIGKNCRFLQGPDTLPSTVHLVRNALKANEAVAVEIQNYRKDGTSFWNNLFIGPVFDPQGNLLYYFASQLDVSERHTSDADARQSQKMEAVGQLTAGLAHDFNNMLMVILGNLEMATNHDHPPRVRRLLDRIEDAAQKGAKITRQLLSFARKTRLDSKAINLNQLVIGFNEILGQTLGSSIELELSLRSRLSNCMLDPSQLEMALLNVLINARDAMPNGGTVSIKTSMTHLNGNAAAKRLAPGMYVTLEIIDTGMGIPEAIIDRVTEPFFTTKPTDKGTGLGLSMVHGFVQQSGGRLEIDSEPGRGTTIRMLFPVEAAETERTPAIKPESKQHIVGGNETILLVEDNEDVMMLGFNILTDLGYNVRTAPDGQKAISELEDDSNVDLLFSDIIMPGGINGLVLAEHVAENYPHIPVLLTTGYIEDLVNKPRTTDRTLDILGKPYKASDLAERVRIALSRGKQQMPDHAAA